MIQLSVPMVTVEIYVYSKNHNFKVDGWQSLKPYQIKFVSGFKYAIKHSKGFNTSTVKTVVQGLKKLEDDRSDLFIGGVSVQCNIERHDFKGIKKLSPHLGEVDLYHYVDKRNKHLVEKLEVVLQEMHESGDVKAILKQTTKEILQ